MERPKPGSAIGSLQTSKSIEIHTPISCAIQVTDGSTTVQGIGRSDDGSDDSIESAAIAEKVVLKVIGRYEAIKPKSVQVVLKSDEEPQKFIFSRL